MVKAGPRQPNWLVDSSAITNPPHLLVCERESVCVCVWVGRERVSEREKRRRVVSGAKKSEWKRTTEWLRRLGKRYLVCVCERERERERVSERERERERERTRERLVMDLPFIIWKWLFLKKCSNRRKNSSLCLRSLSSKSWNKTIEDDSNEPTNTTRRPRYPVAL